MSGGSLDYFYVTLAEHVGDFKDAELDDLVKDLCELFHAREWYLSGDTGEGDWNDSRDAFKKKWFTELGRWGHIQDYLVGFTDELRRSLGVSEEYCQNCRFWIPTPNFRYGECELKKMCKMHRKEYCDEFERREDQ